MLSCKSPRRDNLKEHKCTHFGFQPVTLHEKHVSKSVSWLVRPMLEIWEQLVEERVGVAEMVPHTCM